MWQRSGSGTRGCGSTRSDDVQPVRLQPERDGKVKPFADWSLSELINVAHDVGVLKADVQKLSHGLRDFRNYIHPRQQVASGFSPDEHTATVCLHVLKAALADLAGER